MDLRSLLQLLSVFSLALDQFTLAGSTLSVSINATAVTAAVVFSIARIAAKQLQSMR